MRSATTNNKQIHIVINTILLVMYTVNNSEQLRELSCNDLSFLENDSANVEQAENGNTTNSTVRDLDNILDKFEADTQLLLDNPNQLLNCKYSHPHHHLFAPPVSTFFSASGQVSCIRPGGRHRRRWRDRCSGKIFVVDLVIVLVETSC